MDRERPIAQTVRPIRAAPVADTGFPVCPNCEGGSPLPGEDSAAAAVGTFALVGALEGWILCKCGWAERIVLFIASPLLLFPGTMTDFAGFAGIAAVIGFQFLQRRKET